MPRIASFKLMVIALGALCAGLSAAAPAPTPATHGDNLSTLLPSLHGKVVLLDFWASWCEPCRHSFPWMTDLQKRYGTDLVIVAVNVDQDRQLATRFLETTPAGFRVEFDPSGALATQFDVASMPTSILIDRTGHVRARHRGFRDAQRSEREQAIAQLMKE